MELYSLETVLKSVCCQEQGKAVRAATVVVIPEVSVFTAPSGSATCEQQVTDLWIRRSGLYCSDWY